MATKGSDIISCAAVDSAVVLGAARLDGALRGQIVFLGPLWTRLWFWKQRALMAREGVRYAFLGPLWTRLWFWKQRALMAR